MTGHARVFWIVVLLWGCSDGTSTDPDAHDAVDAPVDDVDVEEEVWDPPPAAEDWDRDILSTGLVVDLSTLEATATITIAASESTAASFEAGGLEVSSVSAPGGPLDHVVTGGRLDVGVPAGADAVIVVDYAFEVQDAFDGLLSSGCTLIWPYYCGNLFPCHSEPEDGLVFTLELTGVPGGSVAVFPESIPANAPSYQIAWSVRDYSYRSLGTTAAGTEVGVWCLPEEDSDATLGTAYLVDAFDWYERTLGPYPFGDRAGSVSVHWGPSAVGGMEHHPYWHVPDVALSDPSVHVHEAAHGWFGGGVRIRCWEDFVLSEGTVTYLTARSTGQVAGASAEAEVWSDYEYLLNYYVNNDDDIAWPDSCGEVDILEDGLYSGVPYYKGAYFYRAVADEIGAGALDDILSLFFTTYVGEAAGMQDMLDMIRTESGFDPTTLAEGWLRSLGRPDL
jgi:aminopeptidase N